MNAYERGYIREKLLRQRAVAELRKHEEKVFGHINPIGQTYGSVPSFPAPVTPERDFTKEELPSCWRADDEVPQPRTPNVPFDNILLRLASKASSRREISSRESEHSERSQSPKPKRIKTPSQRFEDEAAKREEWKTTDLEFREKRFIEWKAIVKLDKENAKIMNELREEEIRRRTQEWKESVRRATG